MAKQRQRHSIEDAIVKCAEALAIESMPNPTEEQKQQIHEAKKTASSVLLNSGAITLAQHGDDHNETQHQVEEILEAGGIDMVQLQRQNAIAGAQALVQQIGQQPVRQVEQPQQPQIPEDINDDDMPF